MDLDTRADATLRWLVRLRWHAVAGQLIAIFLMREHFVSFAALATVCVSACVLAVSNVVLALRTRSGSDLGAGALGAVLLFDSLQFTTQLALSGGANNPFVVLYALQLLVAVLALDTRWIGLLFAVQLVSFTSLFFVSVPLARVPERLHEVGRWLSLAGSVGAIAFLGGRLAKRLREQQAALARSQQLAVRAEKVASLSTLTAGATHELGTPLGTIAIASSELERLVDEDPEEARNLARVMREEVDRCHEILDRLSGRAGSIMAEQPSVESAGGVLRLVQSELAPRDCSRLVVVGELAQSIRCPIGGLTRILSGLIDNALQASPLDQVVTVSVRSDTTTLHFEVRDHGAGIPENLLNRVGEPFFTTKPPGKGMGLGVFLAQSFAELCAGTLEIASTSGQGTLATLTLPRWIEVES